jgi:hypothetical protein
MGRHLVSRSAILNWELYDRPHAWVLKDARELRKPIPYRHPAGAIIWVDLDKLRVKV